MRADAMRAAEREAVARALGARVTGTSPLSGGDINQAFAVTLDDGREVFVKTNPEADTRMFWCEAQGLAWLAEAGALPVPRVLAVSEPGPAHEEPRGRLQGRQIREHPGGGARRGGAPARRTKSEDGGDRAETATAGRSERLQTGPSFLALEMLRPGRRRRDYDEVLGRGLAALHQAGADTFGLPYDNFIGPLPQDNTPCDTWSEFYATRRLLPQAHMAVARGRMPRDWVATFERLAARLDDITAPAEPPARLHGDLWGGNLHADTAGSPVLIDPAVYGGHREVDLAMLALFGGVSERMYDAYDEVFPLAPGWAGRVPLYQLYPLLVHVNLFGSSYLGQVERALRRYV